MLSLIKRLLKIHFSKENNKDYLYKKEIFYTLKDMGGVYNKFLQILCTTRKFMAGWSGPKEFEVYNKVDQEPIDMSWLPERDEYKWISDSPFAGGSFAQVYKAILKNGDEVVLKVLRPSIYNHLQKDLKKLRKIVKIFSIFISNDLIDINETFIEFTNTCLLETDYLREIANMKYFAKMYENSDKIKIPKVYENLSNKFLIVQEYIKGYSLADVITSLKPGENIYERNLELTGSDLWQQLTIVGGELLRCAMLEDFSYGDPHSGNIILLPNNKVAFIDFGIIGNAPMSHKAFYDWTKSYYNILLGNFELIDFMQSTCNCFCPDYINALKKCTNNNFFNVVGDSLESKLKAIEKDNIDINSLIKDGHIFILFTEFIDKNNMLKINLDMKNFTLLKAISAYISTIYTIDKRFESNNFSYLMMNSMNYAFSFANSNTVDNDYIGKTKYNTSQSFELLDDVLCSVANNDEFLFNNIFERMIQK